MDARMFCIARAATYVETDHLMECISDSERELVAKGSFVECARGVAAASLWNVDFSRVEVGKRYRIAVEVKVEEVGP